jgi:hypothetical protein
VDGGEQEIGRHTYQQIQGILRIHYRGVSSHQIVQQKRRSRLGLNGSRVVLLLWMQLLQLYIVTVELALAMYDADSLDP